MAPLCPASHVHPVPGTVACTAVVQMLAWMAAAASSGREPVCDGITGYTVQAVADAARESSVSGQRVAVDSWKD